MMEIKRTDRVKKEVLHKDKKMEDGAYNKTKKGWLDWSHFASKRPSLTRYWREYTRNERRDEKMREEM
jgi:hypothetical protein